MAVADNDNEAVATVVRTTGGADITEGGPARFTLTGIPAPSQDITVNLRVTRSGAFTEDGELGARTVTLGADATATIDIPTVDDSVDEVDGSLTATVEPGTGYAPHGTQANATATAADNDEPSLPTIHIGDAEAAEGEEVHFELTLSHPVAHEVVVYWETRSGTNYHDDSNNHGPNYGSAIPHTDYAHADSRVTFCPEMTRQEFWAKTHDDFHDEGRETFTIVLTEAEGGIIVDELATGTIINSDPMPAAWLARFGYAVAERALDGIAGRIAASRSAGVQGTTAGQALNFDPGSQSGAANDNAGPGSLAGNDLLAQSDVARAFGASAVSWGGGAIGHDTHGFATGPQSGAGSAGSYTMTAREALFGSSFTATGEKGGTGGSHAFWGRATQSSFDGREGTFSLDGEATAATPGGGLCARQLAGRTGAAAEQRGRWLCRLGRPPAPGLPDLPRRPGSAGAGHPVRRSRT